MLCFQAHQFPPTLVVAGVVYERVVQDVVVVVVSANLASQLFYAVGGVAHFNSLAMVPPPSTLSSR